MKIAILPLITMITMSISFTANSNIVNTSVTTPPPIVKEQIICENFPDCPRGGNEEKPPVKTS